MRRGILKAPREPDKEGNQSLTKGVQIPEGQKAREQWSSNSGRMNWPPACLPQEEVASLNLFTKFAKILLVCGSGQGVFGKAVTETHSNLAKQKLIFVWRLIPRFWTILCDPNSRKAGGPQTGLGPRTRTVLGVGIRGAHRLLKSQSPFHDSSKGRGNRNKRKVPYSGPVTVQKFKIWEK